MPVLVDRKIEVGFDKNNAIKESNILQSLGQYFKPEFLNRFDSIIEFKSLKNTSSKNSRFNAQ